MKYKVTVERTETRAHTFEVPYANSREEAEEIAMEMAGDHDFNENTVSEADEEVTHVLEVK